MAGKHFRTASGILFMLLGAAAVLGGRWLEPSSQGCAASWVEFAHRYAFPALLFLGGMALFNRAAFGDLLDGGKQVVGRVIRRKPA